ELSSITKVRDTRILNSSFPRKACPRVLESGAGTTRVCGSHRPFWQSPLSAQQRLFQIGLNRLVAKPDFGQRLIERVAIDAPLGFSIQSNPRSTFHEIEGDDILLLDLLERFHDRRH